MRTNIPAADEVLGKRFKVLDHGWVGLVDYCGGDHMIENFARTSYGQGTRKVSDTRNLIRYLIRNQHVTPLESTELSFTIALPIHVARQLIRHRTMCLSGNTILWFDEPHAINKKKRKRRNISVKEIYHKFTNGSKAILHRHSGLSQVFDLKPRIHRMNLRSCNEQSLLIEHTHITDIWSNGYKPIYRVTLNNGYHITCTKEHLFFTNDGWRTLEEACDLKINNDNSIKSYNTNLCKLGVNGIPLYKNKDWLTNQRKNLCTSSEIAERAECSVHTIKKYLKKYNLQYSKKECGLLAGLKQKGRKKPGWNPHNFIKDKESWLINVKKARRGKNSNFWKGGISTERQKIGTWTTVNAKKIYKRDNYKCVICQNNKKLNAHHIDPVWHNESLAYTLDNLITVCAKCHKILHINNLELQFLDWINNKKDLTAFLINHPHKIPVPKLKKKNKIGRKLMAYFINIKTIEYIGIEETFDLSVDGPYHNFIANGFIVHNSVNEYSARYSEVPEIYYDDYKLNIQSKNNKQGRSEDSIDLTKEEEYKFKILSLEKQSFDIYQEMLGDGVAREVARMHLPLNSYTYWYFKCDLNNLFKLLKLRLDSHAQWEIRQYAKVIAALTKRVAPLAFEAFVDYSLYASNWTRLDKLLFTYIDSQYGSDNSIFEHARKNNGIYKYVVEYAESIGMSKRELDEFWSKLEASQVDSFELDFSTVIQD